MLDPKCKICRRAGVKLFLKGNRCLSDKCAIEQRNFPPGKKVSGYRSRKPSNYAQQLSEKQKVKFGYGLNEAQMINVYKKALSSREATGQKIMKLLESRIDNILYRIGVFDSRFSARQYMTHRGVKVNQKNVKSPSYLIKPGDVINIPDETSVKKLAKASWYQVKDKQISVVRIPIKEEIGSAINEQLIVEYYSR